jgi:crotonobetainyl-CoA:carnitine CoA-transferase CaiB-like acyl-CoA transferase
MHRHDAPQGTDNVLLDLGLDDAEGLSAKAALALKLNELIDQRGLSQAEAAKWEQRYRDGWGATMTLTQSEFEGMCRAYGLGHIAEDPRFATGPARFENRETLIGMMQDILAAKPRAHWIEVLDAVDVPVGPVNDIAESVADPEAEAAGIIGKVPGREDIEVVLSPLSFDGTRPGIRRHPPDLGEYNDAFFAATDEAAP